MTQPWHCLPNAAHIDRILAHIRAHPEVWHAAWWATLTFSKAARKAASYKVANTARNKVGPPVWDAVENAMATRVRNEVWHAAWCSASALIAWDDSAHLLDTDPEQVRLLALLGHHPALLLYPASLALSKSQQNQ